MVNVYVVSTLSNWVDVMFPVWDATSWAVFIYFLAIILLGAFFAVNVFVAIIAFQFSDSVDDNASAARSGSVDTSLLVEDDSPGTAREHQARTPKPQAAEGVVLTGEAALGRGELVDAEWCVPAGRRWWGRGDTAVPAPATREGCVRVLMRRGGGGWPLLIGLLVPRAVDWMQAEVGAVQ
jgi:hypothetical protein